MLKSGRKRKGLIAIGAIICFTLGFTTANSIQQTNWLGYLVHGAYMAPSSEGHGFKIYPLDDNDLPIAGEPSIFSPSVIDSIVIGLREDGVVVWKKAEEIEK